MAATTAATTAFGRKKIRPQKPAGKKQLRRIMLYKQGSSSVYLSDWSSLWLMTDKSHQILPERSSTFTVFDSRSNVKKDGVFCPIWTLALPLCRGSWAAWGTITLEKLAESMQKLNLVNPCRSVLHWNLLGDVKGLLCWQATEKLLVVRHVLFDLVPVLLENLIKIPFLLYLFHDLLSFCFEFCHLDTSLWSHHAGILTQGTLVNSDRLDKSASKSLGTWRSAIQPGGRHKPR